MEPPLTDHVPPDDPNGITSPTDELRGEYALLFEQRYAHLVQVNQPLALITQLPRSGGTLLMRLLDGHPECHAMPIEFEGLDWSRADEFLRGADRAWSSLHSARRHRHFVRGWRQGRSNSRKLRTYPFLLPPELQRSIFYRLVANLDEPAKRTIVTSYITSYFNAWLDNQNLYGSKKRWVTLFTPRLITDEAGLAAWNEIYPDGVILSIARDPRSWYCSARAWSVEWKRLEVAMDSWNDAAQAQLRARDLLRGRLYLLTFDDLVERRQKTMRALARFLGIRFTPSLLVPTMNRMSVKANSSFVEDPTHVSPTARYRKILSKDEIRRIEELALDRYKELREIAKDDARSRKKHPSPVSEDG